MTRSPVKIEDLPQFTVHAVTQGETDEDGDTFYEIMGTFDRSEGVSEGLSWMLLPRGEILTSLAGQLAFDESAPLPALFQTVTQSLPDLVDSRLTYLDWRWKPYQVWMVSEPGWKLTKTLVQAVDASARRVTADSIPDLRGHELEEWIELRKSGDQNGDARYYPIEAGGRTSLSQVGPDGIIKGGWDHVHCEFCTLQISAGDYGYVDIGKHWACETCYAKYVVNHDLSFLSL